MKVFFAVFGSSVSSQASARRKGTQFKCNFTLAYSNQLLKYLSIFTKEAELNGEWESLLVSLLEFKNTLIAPAEPLRQTNECALPDHTHIKFPEALSGGLRDVLAAGVLRSKAS